MLQNNGVALDWVTLFKLKEKDKDTIIQCIKDRNKTPFDPESFARGLGLEGYREDANYDINVKAYEIVALNFCLRDTDFAKDVLSQEDYAKALTLLERKQYSGKLLKELLSSFENFIHDRRIEYIRGYSDGLNTFEEFKVLLKLDVARTARALCDEQAEKSFSPLKKQIEKIASGVKNECYFAAEKISDRDIAIKQGLNGFLVEKYGYDLNRYNPHYGDGNKSTAAIFRLALLDDEEFWKVHDKFNVFAFINAVFDCNDEKHAQKVLSYIFDKIKSNPVGAYLIKNNLPFIYLYKEAVFSQLDKSLLRFFYRFEGIYDLNIIKDEACCYPYTKTENIEEKIADGKEIMNDLIKSVYPADSERVWEFFNEQMNGREPYKVNGYTVKNLLIGYSSCLWYDYEEKRKAVVGYCPDYFSAENIWSRIYLVAFMAHKLESNSDKCYANLFEIFYNLFTAVEKKFGLKTAYQKDTLGRDGAFKRLKNILEKYDVNISEKFKNDYIISLLDRKVAVIEESVRFPVLEQLGDAVYGLAVAEMLFYQPAEIEDESIFKDYDNWVCAQTQVTIAKMLGLDKLYISPLTLSYKHSTEKSEAPAEDIFLLEDNIPDRNCKFKFLADSLEMIIGTICKDCGYQAAIEFTKRIVKETNPEVFKKEIRWENRDEADPEQEIDWEYWNRIKPTPFERYDSYSSGTYTDGMWNALNKFMLSYSLGTEDVEMREFITYRHSHSEYGDELYGKNSLGQRNINYAIYDYLHSGLAYVVEKYSAAIKENYKKINK